MTSPIIRCLKTQLNCELHFLTKQEYLPLIQFNIHLTKIHFFSKKDYIISVLQKESFDLTIDLHNTIQSRALSKRLNSPLIQTDKMPIRKWIMLGLKLNLLNKSHVIDRHFQCIEQLGVLNDGLGMDIFIKNRAPTTVQKKMIILNVGGSSATKRIPLRIVNELNDMTEYPFDVIGGEDVRNIRDKIILNNNSINSIANRNLTATINAIKLSTLVITGDTGIMHIATALDKPIILIWGSTSDDFGFYPYYGDKEDKSIHIQKKLKCRPCSKYGRESCPKKHMKCLNDVSTEEIIAHIDKLFSSRTKFSK